MPEVVVSGTRYRISAERREREWVASARVDETGERFGPELSGPFEAATVDRVERWLGWQAEHAAALEALQQAERSYHRAMAGQAFAAGPGGAGPATLALLDELDAARRRLDAIRDRQPR